MSDVFNTAEDELNFILGNDNVNSSTGQNLNSDGPQYGSYGEEYADPFFDDHNNFEYNASLQEAEEFAANALGVAATKPSPMAIARRIRCCHRCCKAAGEARAAFLCPKPGFHSEPKGARN